MRLWLARTSCDNVESLLNRPLSWLRTITFDNGTEFVNHGDVAEQRGVDIYFAAPCSSCQRGTNENTKGLVHRYLPKGSSFAELSQR